jgi:hypothetical protein
MLCGRTEDAAFNDPLLQESDGSLTETKGRVLRRVSGISLASGFRKLWLQAGKATPSEFAPPAWHLTGDWCGSFN